MHLSLIGTKGNRELCGTKNMLFSEPNLSLTTGLCHKTHCFMTFQKVSVFKYLRQF